METLEHESWRHIGSMHTLAIKKAVLFAVHTVALS
jgi:hypothetical protein